MRIRLNILTIPDEPRVFQALSPSLNLYGFPPGPELDRLVHTRLFGKSDGSTPPPYSSSEKYVSKIAAALEARYGRDISTGTLNLREVRRFARFESGASTATEVVAPTLPLAICRLTLIVVQNYEPVD
jgi:hypothetical protein